MGTPESTGGGTGGGTVPARTGRQESAEERADRRWTDLLQEVRVAQTGSQVLFGFLMSVAFMPRFAELGSFDRGLYVATVLLGTLATASLTAPVACHRIFAGRRLKPQLVDAAARLVGTGLVMLALTIGSSMLLLLRVATGSATAGWIIAVAMLWFVNCWLILPLRHLRRHNGHPADRTDDDRPRGAAPDDGRTAGAGRPGAGAGKRAGSRSGSGSFTGAIPARRRP